MLDAIPLEQLDEVGGTAGPNAGGVFYPPPAPNPNREFPAPLPEGVSWSDRYRELARAHTPVPDAPDWFRARCRLCVRSTDCLSCPRASDSGVWGGCHAESPCHCPPHRMEERPELARNQASPSRSNGHYSRCSLESFDAGRADSFGTREIYCDNTEPRKNAQSSVPGSGYLRCRSQEMGQIDPEPLAPEVALATTGRNWQARPPGMLWRNPRIAWPTCMRSGFVLQPPPLLCIRPFLL